GAVLCLLIGLVGAAADFPGEASGEAGAGDALFLDEGPVVDVEAEGVEIGEELLEFAILVQFAHGGDGALIGRLAAAFAILGGGNIGEAEAALGDQLVGLFL